MKAYNVSGYIDMFDYHDTEENDSGFDGTFHIRVEAESSQEAEDKVMDDCAKSNCPYSCEPQALSVAE